MKVEQPEINLGRRVRQAREGAGMSQAALASEMGKRGFSWHQTTVAKTEAAERPVRVNEAVALAEVFETTLGDLVSSVLPPGVAADWLPQARARLAEVEEEWAEVNSTRSRAAGDLERLEAQLRDLEGQRRDLRRIIEGLEGASDV